MSENLKDIADKFTEQISKINMEGEREFINELMDAIETPKVKIPEPVFREIFLPYFTGEKKATKSEEAVAHWVGLVGSATESAEVVSVKGEVLFEVPPMYDSDKINTVKKETDMTNLGSIFSNYAEQAVVHQALGQRYLAEELAKKTQYIEPNKDTGKSWEPVLKYYGLIKQEEEKVKTQVNGDDDLEFDDD